MTSAQLTLHLIRQGFDLRVRRYYKLVHLLIQSSILVRKIFCQRLLVNDFLRHLIAVEAKPSTRTFCDDRRTEAAQHAGFIIFSRIEAGDNNIVRMYQLRVASWTLPFAIGCPRETG